VDINFRSSEVWRWILTRAVLDIFHSTNTWLRSIEIEAGYTASLALC
jgi:hypothetical protein